MSRIECVASSTSPKPITVKTAHATGAGERTKAQLERVLKTFDLKKWTFTRDIVIDAQSLPHSHPVLSLNTDYESVGEERARRHIEFYAGHHYRWVYRTILADREKIEAIVRKYKLAP